MDAVFSQVLKYISDALKAVVNLLPNSPFHLIDNSPIAEYLGYINYFVPFDFIVATLQIWLMAVGCYYLYSAILRWVKAIK